MRCAVQHGAIAEIDRTGLYQAHLRSLSPMRRRMPEERVADMVLRGEHGLRPELRDRSAGEAVCYVE
jgi:hypothetical protein